jgi:hypothetical protein
MHRNENAEAGPREGLVLTIGVVAGVCLGCLLYAQPSVPSVHDLMMWAGQIWQVPDRLGCSAGVFHRASLSALTLQDLWREGARQPQIVGSIFIVGIIVVCKQLAAFLGGGRYSAL